MSKATQLKVKEKPFTIPRGDIKEMHHAHHVWVVSIPKEMTKAELEDSHVWSFASAKGFKVHDRVEVLTSNGSQLSLGICTFVYGNDVRVQIYAQHELHEQAQTEIEYMGFVIKYVSNDRQWCIFNQDDGKELKSNMPTDTAAMKYLKDHFKALGQSMR